jgi:putative ABC transport system permease protein
MKFWRSWTRREAREADLERELRDHLDLEAEEQREAGLPPEEASYAARRAFGNTVRIKEDVRMAWGFQWLETFLQDVRYGLRQLRRNPGFTIVAILTLALGIGANTAIFSVVNAVLMRPLRYRNPDRIVRLWENDTHGSLGPYFSVSVPNFVDWRQQNRVFESMGAFASVPMALTGGMNPEQVRGAYITASVLQLLGISPAIGRTFLPDEDQPGRDHEVILSYGLWQRRFGGDRTAIGKSLTLDGNVYTVVGVMPAEFDFPPNSETEVWVPMSFSPGMLQQRAAHIINVVARLKLGKTFGQASAQMETIARRLEQEYPESNNGWRVTIVPLHDAVVREVRPALLVLLVAVGLVLLLACANITNLIVAKVASREREIAIRTALGAGRIRLARQLLTESVLLATVGGVLGFLIALMGIQGLLVLKPPELPLIGKINFDWRIWTFASIATFACTLSFSLVPILQGTGRTGRDLTNALKEGGRTLTASVGSQKLRHALIVAEVSLASVLLVGAGLLVRSLLRLQNVNPGFNPRNILTAEISLPESNYHEPYQQAAFFGQLLQSLQHLPGVVSAGAFNADNVVNFTVEGLTPSKPGEQITGRIRWATPNYFQTMGIPLVRGRVFTERDNDRAPKVIVINQTMVRRYFGNDDPIGKRIILGWGKPMWREIIGVVGDVKYGGLSENPGDEFYIPIDQTPLSWMTLVIRTSGNPSALASSLRNTVWSVDKDVPVSNLKTMEERLGESVAQPRFRTILLGIFAGFALLLATIGIYGVVSYWVAQRYHDFGIRMALGAEARNVIGLVLWQSLKLLAVGAGIGLVGAVSLTRLMSSLLYGVKPGDPPTFFAVFAVLFGVALLASYIPARRATKVDPMVALRWE